MSLNKLVTSVSSGNVRANPQGEPNIPVMVGQVMVGNYLLLKTQQCHECTENWKMVMSFNLISAFKQCSNRLGCKEHLNALEQG